MSWISALAAFDVALSVCSVCKSAGIWYGRRLIWPTASPAPAPNSDMPKDVLSAYNEAASVVGVSPRAAAGLLRLALQYLVDGLIAPRKSINDKIGMLVQDGMPTDIQMAMDALRVIGNDAVHPGQIDVDDQDVALALFHLVNTVVENRISSKRRISTLYAMLPENKVKAIEERDK